MKNCKNEKMPKIGLLLRSEERKDGESRISFVIRFAGTTIRKSSGYSVRAENWNAKKGEIVGNDYGVATTRKNLRLKIVNFEDYMGSMDALGYQITRKMIDDFFEDKRYDDFFTFYDSSVEKRLELASSTKNKYLLCSKVLKKNCKVLKMERLRFYDLTPAFVSEFDKYLIYTLKVSGGTANNYHKCLKYVLSLAISEGILTNSPYFRFKAIKTSDSPEIEALDMKEIEKIESLNVSKNHLVRVRDYFLFLSYTGLRYNEMFTLSTEKINVIEKHDSDGNKSRTVTIKLYRSKTKDYLTIPLSFKARLILHRYRLNNGLENGMIFPVIKNAVFNRQLKEIAKMANLEKNLRTHLGRHSFATNLRKLDVPLEDVSELLGHKDLRMTKRYAKVNMNRLSDAVGLL